MAEVNPSANDTPGGESTDELASIPYEVINDKSLSTQDHLFKQIIIGDTGKFLLEFNLS